MQSLIVLSCVLAGTDLPSADRSVNFLDSNALMRAPTMRSAKLGRRSANREVPWTLEAPIAATCQTAFSLTHSQFRSTDCPSLQDPQRTSSISEPSTLCAPTSANSACFPDHQPPPAQHRPLQSVSATSQSISPVRNTRFLSPYSGNSPFLLDHAASTSVACMVSNTPVPDRKGCPTAHRR